MTEKLKVYLDTNIIYDYFQRTAKEIVENKEFRNVKKLLFIQNNPDFLEAYTSFFTLIEVADRIMRDFDLKPERVRKIIESFIQDYKIEILRSVTLTEETLDWFLSNISMKDAIQLNIALNERLVFITEDDKLFRKARKITENVMKFNRLVRIIKNLKRREQASSILMFFPSPRKLV